MSDLLIEKNLNRARSFLIKGELIEASNLLNSIINNFPQNKKVQSFIQQLKQSSLKQSYPSKEKINTLLKYYKNGELINAENLALSLTKEFPRHAFGWKVLGVILGDTGRKIEALSALQTALEIAPQDPRTHNNLGNILKNLGKFEEAELSFKQSINNRMQTTTEIQQNSPTHSTMATIAFLIELNWHFDYCKKFINQYLMTYT